MKPFIMLFVFWSISTYAISQIDCHTALNNLHAYAGQINNIYNNEYWRAIPLQRCPAVDFAGRPFNPVVVQNCRLNLLGQLNNWYGQQCQYINNWYVQIFRGCSIDQSTSVIRPAPSPISGKNENQKIDTKQISDLTSGIDDERVIKIRIPSTAEGFRPKQ